MNTPPDLFIVKLKRKEKTWFLVHTYGLYRSVNDLGSFREIRRVDSDKVKLYIDSSGFYTVGTSKELYHLLSDLCNPSIVIHLDNIEVIATDIFNHSSKSAINKYVNFVCVPDFCIIGRIMTDLVDICISSSFIKL